MNNEPVAWIDPRELDMAVSTSVTKNKQFDTDIPLYTHPAKTLTDEEIQELALCDEFWISEDCTIFDWHKFARAILRKAQEK
jgi:hypothetical protein